MLMVLSQKSRLQTSQDGKLENFDEKKSKVATDIVQILDFFLRNMIFDTPAF